MKYLAQPVWWIGSNLAGILAAPEDPSDLVVTLEAEDKHNFKDRLKEIAAPTLVVAGKKDLFYTEQLFRETAEGIPNARLILYEGMGHPVHGEQFRQDVLFFLNYDRKEKSSSTYISAKKGPPPEPQRRRRREFRKFVRGIPCAKETGKSLAEHSRPTPRRRAGSGGVRQEGCIA
jgi:hypothetical protein